MKETNRLHTNRLHTGWLVTAMVVVLLVIDQIIKLYIKTHFCLGESVRVTDWFYIEFVENNGMAWGMSFISKLWLSLLRLVAIVALIWYLRRIISRGKHRLVYIYLVALVLAGAVGNMLDSMFYGLMFTASSPYYVSYSVPFGEGYAPFLMGKVVDMFRFPFFSYTWPEWVPVFGGQHGTFFDPVFNFADACVSVGIISLLLFCRPELEELGEGKNKKAEKDETKDAKSSDGKSEGKSEGKSSDGKSEGESEGKSSEGKSDGKSEGESKGKEA